MTTTGTACADPDSEAFNEILAELEATQAFAAIGLRGTVRGADQYPAAILSPTGWSEADQVDPIQPTRTVNFELRIEVKNEEPIARALELNRLMAIARRAINWSSLGGTALPMLTRIRGGRRDITTKNPVGAVNLEGEFTTLELDDPTDPLQPDSIVIDSADEEATLT